MSKHTTSDFSFPEKKCVHELFELQADRLPNATALVFGDQSMTYGELDKKANQLAHLLQRKGIKPELAVAICVERSLEMMIAILGVLKAGGAYVPIDPNYPQERIQFMLEDTRATILLTQNHLSNNIFTNENCETICLDSDWEKIKKEKTSKPFCKKLSGNLIYTIYTSGSTGKPKGVQVEHRNVVNLIQGQMHFVKKPVKRFLYAYSFAFDGSVLLMWWTLLQGATMVIAKEGMEKDVQLLGKFIDDHKISHLLTFPSVYTILLDQVNVNRLLSLEYVSVAGEACPSNLVIQHQQILPKTKLLNQYGPTEATVGATIYITPENFEGEKVPIGKPIDNVQIYILNEKLEKVKAGEIGEIHIGGKGVARGYLNRKELTKEKFIQNPFGKKKKDRLYKSGDLGRFLPDGNIDFIGRADHQVKLRGYRIEMGEVEAAISQHPNVRETVVDIFGEKSTDQKLVGYLTLKNGTKLNATQLRNFLEEKIPEYMIPSTFMFLEKMPFATSGKIDRKNLPQPNNARPDLEQKFVASETNLEDWLTQLWQEVLGLEKIGIDDKFFELGGNSLQAAAFVAKVQKELNETVFIVSIFEAPTIREYAKFLEKNYHNVLSKSVFQNRLNSNERDKTSNVQRSTSNELSKTDFKAFKNYIPTFIKKVKKQNRKNPPAIFILAPPRSGTTLLRIMLAGHPQLFAANELQLLHFNTLQERKEAYTGKFSLWSEGTIRTIMELKNCDADKAKSIMQTFEEENLTTQEFYQVLQKWVGNRIIVDKSPSYAMDMMALKKAEADFDNAIFIHLSRHPYSMIKSFEKMHMDQVMFLNKHNYNSRNTGELIWYESHQNIFDFLKKIPADRQFRIIYEDLVQQPKEVMEAMCETIGLPFHPNLLNPYLGIEKKMTDGLYDNSKPMGDPNLLKHGSIKSKKAEEWKKVKDDNFLHFDTWKLAEKIGYEPLEKNMKEILLDYPKNSTKGKTKKKKEKKQEPQIIPEVTSSHSVKNNDIAIIGMSGRFPGAKNLTEFWENLITEKDVSVEFTAEELVANGIDPNLLNDPNYVRRGMPLQDTDKFDASFFGYLPKEAALMDPQHRLFLECAYAALEDAGYVSEKYKGTIGIYGGVARNTYLVNNVITHPKYFQSIEDFTKGITQEKDFPATRVAYKLNLKGAAVNVQTACSSSGVAVHLACQSLLAGDNDMMLVGGGRIQPPVEAGHLHTEGHALSPDGYCRSFDADADGMVRGNGMAFIVLKKLEKAIVDGDSIHAIIKSTAIGNDGSDKVGFTAPSVRGQAETIAKAYQKANINPETINYIEAHGTGTRIGDPIEIAALTQAFSKFTDKKNFCAISSVKSNIGHFDAGACVAGIIKAVLSLKHGKLPTTLHFKQPNPQIDFKRTPFFVNDKLRKWKKGDTPRRAGVSSFGLGGTNAHIILEEAPELKKTINTRSHNLLLLSAKKETALARNAYNLGAFLEENEVDLANVAYTLQVGRNHFQHRLFTIADNVELASVGLKNLDKKKVFAKNISKKQKHISFMFPGGGAQHTNMGIGLYENEPVFQQAVDKCVDILKTKHDLDLREILFPNQEVKLSQPLENPLHAIALLFTIEYATAQLWMSYGIRPKEMIGHSLGEYVAACIAGVFRLEDAMAMVVKRGELFQTLPLGGMLSVPMSPKEVQPFMDENLSFAAINKPDHCVVSGSVKAIDRIKEKLNTKEIHSTRLHIRVAAHSLEVEPILKEFKAFLQKIKYSKPKIPIISNLTGTWAKAENIASPKYWVNHLRQTVRFAEGVETLLQQDDRILLEVGPGQTLSTFARQHPAKQKSQVILASLRHPKETIPDLAFFQKTLGQLWLDGVELDFELTNNGRNYTRISLPTYSFEKVRHWIDAKPYPEATASVTTVNSEVGASKYIPQTDFPLKENGRNMSQPTPPQFNRRDLILRDLKNIFQDLSGIDAAEMDEQASFLELGFDSLFLTQAVGKIKKQLKVELSFRQLFEEAPNFDELVSLVETQISDEKYQSELEQLNTENAATQNVNQPVYQSQNIQPLQKVEKRELILRDLKNIFQDLSGIDAEEMDEQASFLELGFDSLFLTQAVGKIKKGMQVELSFRQLFEEAPNFDELTNLVETQISPNAYEVELASLNAQRSVQEVSQNQNPILPTTQLQVSNLQQQMQQMNFPNSNAPVGTIQEIIQQQLQLMQLQMVMLQGGNLNTNQPQNINQTQNPTSHQNPKLISKGKPSPPLAGVGGWTPEKPKTKITDSSNEKQQVKKGQKFNHWAPIEKKNKSGLTEQQETYLKDLIKKYTKKTKGSQALTQAQRKHLADPRSISGFNKLWKDMIYQIAVERSKGSKIWDVDGNEYIDYRSAFGISLFGHTPDFIQEAVKKQLGKGIELGVLTPLAKKVADLLCELSGTERVTFVNTGSESLSAAVRAARTVTMKDKIAYFEGDYHGIADEMLAKGVERNGKSMSLPVSPGIPKFLVENVIVFRYDDPNVLEKIKMHADDLAAILIEPIQPNNPTHQPRELLQAIRQVTAENDIALIFDEMITGFRTGMRGAQGWYDIEADIVCYGKIISGGLPMAAVAGKSKYLDVFDGGAWQFGDESVPEVGVTFFGGTFVRHPLSMASAYAALSEIKRQGQKMYDELNEKTARFVERVRDLFLATKVPMKVHSTASIIAFKPTDNNPLAKLFFYYLQYKGIHIAEKAALVTVAHTQEDLDKTYQAIEETIRLMQTAGFFKITVADVIDENKIIYPPNQNQDLNGENHRLPINGKKKIVPLTEGQQEVWIEQRLGNEAAAAYNLSSDFLFEGKLEIEALRNAIQQLVQRHESLRTFFSKENTTQVILPELEIGIPILDFSHLNEDAKNKQVEKLRFDESELPLDLFAGPLCRFKIIKLSENKHRLFMTVHHAIADGWSCGILANDLQAIYNANVRGQKANLPEAKQLSAYALEQANFKNSTQGKANEVFWEKQFANDIPILDFPTDRSRPPVKTYNCDLEKITFNEELFDDLKKTAAKNGTTFFFLMYSAFHTFLHRLSGQEDLVLGLVAAGQTIAGNQNLVTHGVSLLPVRMQVEKQVPFSQHLKYVRGKVLDAFEHQNYTLGALVKKLKLPRDLSRQPIISILFNMDAEGATLQFENMKAELNPIPRNYETFDMFINVKPTKNNCHFELIYNTDLFFKETIQRRLKEFETLLKGIVENPNQAISHLPILPDFEKQQLLGEWNATKSDFPKNICLHELIEKQMERTPEKVALEFKGQQLNYAQLNKRVNQLAHFLISKNIQKGEFVGIFVERSLEMVIGLLAIMKVGGIYVPLDPSNPKDRLQVIIEDAQAKTIISNQKMIGKLPQTNAKIILLDKIQNELSQSPKENPKREVSSEDFVYVLYTSGSSGNPKGLLIPHYAVVDHHYAMIERIGFSKNEAIFSVATVSFDPSVQDFFLPLLIGAKVIVAEQEAVSDGFLLKKRLEESKATLLQATPATWRMLNIAGWEGHSNFTVLTGGEGLTSELANVLLQKSKAVWNIYGPTETTIWSTAKKIEKIRDYAENETAYEPVGRPINNVQIYLLDEFLQPVPIGAAGEVFIGGVGVAPGGYFKREELTEEKFIDLPASVRRLSESLKNTRLGVNDSESRFTEITEKIYRTGDIARYLPNGDLEYLRRADGQVKIRGFRIELGEIESAISQIEGVAENVVIVREDQKDNKVLAAYVVMKNGKEVDGNFFKKSLKNKLPDYMVPTAFVGMKSFPLTATLKIDRKKLPVPDLSRNELETGFIAPRTELEKTLAKIWTGTIGVPNIGINDNFFELGGHSLIAVGMMARIEKATGKNLSLSVLLENATIKSLASLMEDDEKVEETWNSLVPVKSTGSKPPIYIVHGAGLHVMLFNVLGNFMDEEQPVFALQAKGLNGDSEPLDRMEDIAAHYVSEILKHNPCGPYTVAGYSFGGLIAFEMAKQLKAQGKEIALLGMFDTIVQPYITKNMDTRNFTQKFGDRFKKTTWDIGNFIKNPGPNYEYRAYNLKKRFERWKYKKNENKPEANAEVDALGKVDRANGKAYENYKITPYDGTIHLFRAKEKRFYLKDFEFLGWRPYAKKIIVNEVGGDHIKLFDGKDGEDFAKILQRCLDEQFGKDPKIFKLRTA